MQWPGLAAWLGPGLYSRLRFYSLAAVYVTRIIQYSIQLFQFWGGRRVFGFSSPCGLLYVFNAVRQKSFCLYTCTLCTERNLCAAKWIRGFADPWISPLDQHLGAPVSGSSIAMHCCPPASSTALPVLPAFLLSCLCLPACLPNRKCNPPHP